MADERSAVGQQMQLPGLEGIQPRSRSSVNAKADVSIPKVDKLNASVKELLRNFKSLQDLIQGFANSGSATKLAGQFGTLAQQGSVAAGAAQREARTWGRGGAPSQMGAPLTVWQQQGQRSPADMARGVFAPSGGGGGGAPPLSRTGPSSGDASAGRAIGTGVGQAGSDFLSNITGQNGIIPMLTAPLTGVGQMYGALAGGSLQYTYNRINGPTGNMNAMLQLANALAPNVTMMNAAGARMPGGGSIGMQGMIEGLAQRMPVMGTQQDMLQTILAGQGVGALMSGTPNRNGFFESVRQMQALNPGQSPGTSSASLAGYMQNTRAQQMGVFMGEGAFTMIGSGGRYKTLAEWAEGITKFFEQHRPGGAQGKGFSPEELITQNFPGSNINAWFQMMGVPQNMVDYWWQYVLTNTSGVPASQVTSQMLGKMTGQTRGMNLGVEQLRASTQSTRRDFLMGNQMYGMYGLNAAANRRFNVQMQGTDQALAQQLQNTNIGRMIALLPTPIMEMLMPILSQFVSSPIGGAAAAVGSLFGDPDGHAMPYGAPAYGEAGGTTTAHLSPDLAKRVDAMMAANPRLQMTSGYRDTVTQNRLRRNGAGAVGHPSKSAHTRGWAADIGPASQMGWLMQNAGRFGLQTAAAQGEPWHIQRSGTLMGDPGGDRMPYGDFLGLGGIASDAFDAGMGMVTDPVGTITGAAGSVIGGIAGDIASAIFGVMKDFMSKIMKLIEKPIQKLLSSFVGGGGFSSMIDTATGLFSQLLTAPIAGLANLGGKAGGGMGQVDQLINQEAPSRVSVIGSGFTSSGSTISSTPIFGDPPMPEMISMPSMQPRSGSTIIFQTSVTLQGMGGSSGEARKVANNLLDHLETEANKRQWLTV